MIENELVSSERHRHELSASSETQSDYSIDKLKERIFTKESYPELDKRLIKYMRRPDYDDPTLDHLAEHSCIIEDVIFGYKSVTTSKNLFLAIEKVFRKSLSIPRNKQRLINCLLFLKNWISSNLYKQDYKTVEPHLKAIIKEAKKCNDQNIICLAKQLETMWKKAILELGKIDFFMENIKIEQVECQNLQDLIWHCQYDPQAVANSFRSFFSDVLLSIELNDLLNPDKSAESSSGISALKNSFMAAAAISDKVTHEIMYDLLSKDSIHDAEERYFFYLKVAHEALEAYDTATTLAIHNALNNSSIERLNLLGKRPKYKGIWENIGFNKRKKREKRIYDQKVIYQKNLEKKCSYSNKFANIRSLELNSYDSPRVLAILASDIMYINETPKIHIDIDRGPHYNVDRIASFAKVLREFNLNQNAMRKASCTSKYSIARFIKNSTITEDELDNYSYQLKPSKHVYRQWQSFYIQNELICSENKRESFKIEI